MSRSTRPSPWARSAWFRQFTRRLRPANLKSWLALVAHIAVLLPLAWGFAWMVHEQWIPTGDDALIGLRTLDVFTENPPVMGQRSTSHLLGADLASHHPGPLQYYILAVPALIAGSHPYGLLLGMLLLCGWSSSVALRAAFQTSPAALFGISVALLALMALITPQELLRPYNMSAVILPSFALMCVLWRVVLGDNRWLPHAVFLSSFGAQTHSGLLPVMVVLGGLVGLVLLTRTVGPRWRRLRRRPRFGRVWRLRRRWTPQRPRKSKGGARWPGDEMLGWLRLRGRPGRQAVLVLLACWAPVLIETLTYDPPNVAQIVRYVDATGGLETIGAVGAVGLLSQQMTRWQTSPFFITTEPRAIGIALLVAGGLALLGAAMLRIAGRRSPTWLDGCATATGGVVAALVAASSLRADQPMFYGMVFLPFSFFLVGTGIAAMLDVLVRPVVARIDESAPGRGSILLSALSVAVVATSSVQVVAQSSDSTAQPNDELRRHVATVTDQVQQRRAFMQAVRIESPGIQGWVTVAPTLAYALEAEGVRTTFKIYFPIPADDDHRKNQYAPANALVVYLREASEDEWQTVRPPGEPISTFSADAGLGMPATQVDAYILEPDEWARYATGEEGHPRAYEPER